MFEGIKQIFELLSPKERRQLPWLFAAVAFMALLEVLGIASVMPFLAIITNPQTIHTSRLLQGAYDALGFSSTRTFLFATGGIVLALLVTSNLMTVLITWALLRYSMMRNHSISTRLLRQYLNQDYAFFLVRNSADLSANILGEVAQFTNGILIPSLNLFAKSIVALAILGLLFAVDPVLTLVIALVLGGAYALIYVLIRSRLLAGGEQRAKSNVGRYKLASEAFGGIKDLKLLAKEQAFVDRYSKISHLYSRSEASGIVLSTLPRYALETIAFGGILVIVLYLIAANKNLAQVISVVGLYAFAAYRLLPALQQIFFGVATVRYNRPALEKLYRGANESESPVTALINGLSATPLGLTRAIELRDVTFRYATSDNPAVDHMSVQINANTTVGFVGSTGSGKTTTVDIILGLLRPQEGDLLVDGRKIGNENMRAWRRNLGYVSQHIYLYDDTIASNIAFGLSGKEIDDEAVERAARVANLHDFIVNELSDGYQTVIGERGIRLSGGERQRVGIARALYYDPAVLVLDEATSALDGITESLIIEAIHNLAHQKTIIMIAHRISTVRDCDVIFVLERGRIVAEGDYQHLLQNDQRFREMAKLTHQQAEAVT